MRASRRVAERMRSAVGRAVHRVGVTTHADIREVREEIHRLAIALERFQSTYGPALEDLRNDAQTRLEGAEQLLSVEAVARFIRHARLRTEPLLSVILPTHNRPDRLRRAIHSVIAQRYERWELLVVDDGGEKNSQPVVEAASDPRIQWMRIEKAGVGAARNRALARASGEIIAYLDDDNTMDPDWLYSVVWAFEQRPDVDVLYGAFVIDDLLRVDGRSSGQMPRMFLRRWSREDIRHGNVVDIGAIAHRSGLPEARFDESLATQGDWDLLLRLTEARDPLVLPAVACYYMTDAPDRLTGSKTEHADRLRVIERGATHGG